MINFFEHVHDVSMSVYKDIHIQCQGFCTLVLFILHVLVVQFSPNFRCIYILTLAVILQCQKWITTESESINLKFRMYRHNGPRSHPSLYKKYYHTL